MPTKCRNSTKVHEEKNVVGTSHWRMRKETHHLNFSKEKK